MKIKQGVCNARCCEKTIRHDKLFCIEHWHQIPAGLRLSLVEYYTIGQDQGDVVCSTAWLAVVCEAIDYIGKLETYII